MLDRSSLSTVAGLESNRDDHYLKNTFIEDLLCKTAFIDCDDDSHLGHLQNQFHRSKDEISTCPGENGREMTNSDRPSLSKL